MRRLIRNNPIRSALFALFIILVIILRVFDVASWLNIRTLQQYQQYLMNFVHAYYWQSVVIFIALYAVEVMFALPFAFVFSIAGGFLYGTWLALVYIVVGATSGAVLSFMLTRYVIGNKIQAYYQHRMDAIHTELERNGAYYLILLRLIPVLPFFLVNIAAGLTRVSLGLFACTTAIGIVPGALLYAAAGHQLRVINSLQDIFTWNTIIIFALLILFAMTPIIMKKWYNWKPLETDSQ